jgi:Tfp pilus assembly protein PilF
MLNRYGFIILLFLICMTTLPVCAATDVLHDAWAAYCAPALDPASYPTQADIQRARQTAIALLEQADRKDATARKSLGYFYLRNYQYIKAKEQFEAGIKRDGKDPVMKYLLAQTKSVLLLAEPDTMREQCKEPIEEFRRAAAREPDNALPLLQSASVAFDCGRPDLALNIVTEALKRPAYRLYSLPVPTDLSDDPVKATKAWWWAQSELWTDTINRTSNCVRWLVQYADRAYKSRAIADSDKLYNQAAQAGALMCKATPPLASATSAGLEAQRQALSAQSICYTKGRPDEATAVCAKLAKVQEAQKVLETKWQEQRVTEIALPPASVDAIMAAQKKLVESIPVVP